MQERRKGPRREREQWASLVLGGAPLNQRRPPGAISPPSYYAYPPLKRPHWRPEVFVYFFAGGLASAAYVVATIADLLGNPADRPIPRPGRYLALLGMLVSPVLLIRDLGRPDRFHHMLRLFKFRSPMSVGTWALTLFGLTTGVAATAQAAADGLLGRGPHTRLLALVPLRLLGVGGSLLACFVASYTGVLLAFTNVPFWAGNRRLLGPLFLASALSSGLAAITLVLEASRAGSHAALARLHRADVIALSAELALLAGSEVTLGRFGTPLTRGRLARPYRLGVQLGGVVLPLLLQAPALRARPLPRLVSLLAALLVLAGGLLTRRLVVEAGKLSADYPAAYFAYTSSEFRVPSSEF